MEGEAAAGYEVNGYTTSCNSVWVSGPESLVGQITAVGIEIGVDGAAEDLTGTASPVFYDANGNPLNLGEQTCIRDRFTHRIILFQDGKVVSDEINPNPTVTGHENHMEGLYHVGNNGKEA